jgi:hypothetical protein
MRKEVLTMARVDADQFVEKHARRLKGAMEDMRRGVERVTEAPTAKAARKVDKLKANWLKAVDEGKWARRLNSVSLDEWKSKMIEKGIPRVSAGIDAAADKVRAFAQELLPHIDAGKAAIEKMPDVTLEDNIQRMTAFIRHMAKFKRKG